MENNREDQSLQVMPKSLGIIMDGNRRWARERGLTPLEGHKVGLEKIKEVLSWAQDAGVSELTFYAFSTENWKREEKEVSYLLGLIEFAFGTWMEEVIEKDICVRVIGERERFSDSIREKIKTIEERTKNAKAGTLVLALSYGGRSEILTAVNKLIESEIEYVTEEELRGVMWSSALRDPDLIIRTSGEQRLSNFLTWQSAYSELSFTDTKWPALTKEEFDSLLADYAKRDRRFGK